MRLNSASSSFLYSRPTIPCTTSPICSPSDRRFAYTTSPTEEGERTVHILNDNPKVSLGGLSASEVDLIHSR